MGDWYGAYRMIRERHGDLLAEALAWRVMRRQRRSLLARLEEWWRRRLPAAPRRRPAAAPEDLSEQRLPARVAALG